MAVSLAILGVALELSVSANLLTWAGVPYVSDGGSIAVKLHPGTYLLGLAFLILVARPGGWAVLAQDSKLAAFIFGMTACLIYLLVATGTGNLIVLLDTFLPAGLLAAVLQQATKSQLLALGRMMRCLLAINAVLALIETAAQATLVPLYLNDTAYHPHIEDFRPTALFDHPLTGATMTMLGLALSPQRGISRLAYIGLMWAALVAYGGRMALAVSIAIALAAAVWRTGRLMLLRDGRAVNGLLASVVIGLGALLFALLALWAGFGARVVGHLYWDESAQVRLAQWQLLDHLDGWQLLFGTRRDDLLSVLNQLWLASGVEVIENFWLLMFASFGAMGFPLFVGSLVALLAWCWRRTTLRGRLLLLGVMLVASTSNSLGRKSTVLVCTVAAVVASLPMQEITIVGRGRFRMGMPVNGTVPV